MAAWADALALANLGFYIFPLGHWQAPDDRHKTPCIPGVNWKDLATCDTAQVNRWAEEYPDHNYGVSCGPSNLTVIDIDVDAAAGKDGLTKFNTTTGMLLSDPPNLSKEWVVRTPRGGMHLYYRGAVEKPRAQMTGMDKMVDIKSTGGYVVGPGCRAPTGAEYAPAHARTLRAPNPLPASLKPMCAHPAAPEPAKQADTSTGEKTVGTQELRRILSHLDPDGYSDWFGVLAAVTTTTVYNDDGQPDPAERLQILFDWSQGDLNLAHSGVRNPCTFEELEYKTSDKCMAQTLQAGHKSIGSLIFEAGKTGYKPPVGQRPAADASRFANLPTVSQTVADMIPNDIDKWEAECIQDGEWHKLDKKLDWLCDGLIERAGLHIISGGYGTLKTYLMLTTTLDMCQGISTYQRVVADEEGRMLDIETFHKVQKPIRAIYVAGEGAFGYENRVAAYKKHRNITGPIENFYFLPTMPLLADDASWGSFVAFVERKAVDMVVFDTKTWLMITMDQNATRDAGFAIQRIKELRLLDVAVVLVDHTGKDFERGTKGAVDIPGAAELELIIKGKPKNGILSVRMNKCKNGPEWDMHEMRFQVHSVLVDEGGPVPENATLTFEGRHTKGPNKPDGPSDGLKDFVSAEKDGLIHAQVGLNIVADTYSRAWSGGAGPENRPNEHYRPGDLSEWLGEGAIAPLLNDAMDLHDPERKQFATAGALRSWLATAPTDKRKQVPLQAVFGTWLRKSGKRGAWVYGPLEHPPPLE